MQQARTSSDTYEDYLDKNKVFQKIFDQISHELYLIIQEYRAKPT